MTVKGKIHSVETFGTVDGPGIRYVIFFQGCPLRCKFCHNRDTWNLEDGKEISVSELVDDIKKYIPFIKASGGGVTISGGEPTLQSEFLLNLLKELKKHDLHTCLDTSGFISSASSIDEILEYVDLVLLDLKHIDPAKHKNLTGVDNHGILSFAKYLDSKNMPMWIRHVVIPTITDEEAALKALAEFVFTLDAVKKVDLLPYHSMGKFKWKEYNSLYPLEGIRDANEADIAKARSIFNKYSKYSLTA
ncbi:pyruvate formate-lyase-activating protein [Clostridium formicaceticum]|uniref:Pyruvate formate-lyase-activating enzyme n=1 Tax=Clostridium formicaceticum TaxID=1497 RepID=A0AAC9WFW9_9CLOT|nr:pyruvate formate-lyase-activating protein [Clostridium formicaceticum]AOY76760.1 pyruvate formate-lyase 1-activating enzyme [Clostridium formicaceticum]ARE87211.1 Pyruvate formate-lyase 1-activating enzyme [Clostridium formicaceticum]